MNRKTYRQFLKSKAWVNLREVYRKDTNYKCQVCKSKNKLNLHHIVYSKDLLDPINIIVLCKEHHRQSHFRNGKFRYTTGLRSIKQLT